jgi:hypothetical protein
MLVFAFVGFSCTSSKHAMTSQPASLAVAQEFTHETTAAAAQSKHTSVGVLQQDNTPEVGELTASASNVNTVVKDVKKDKLRQKLVQLQSQLEKMKAENAAPTAVNSDAKPAKTPLTARLLMNKLTKKTNKVARTNQINDTEASKANSSSSLLYLGVILAAVGLILVLVTSGSAASAGLVILIIGVVMAVVGLLA